MPYVLLSHSSRRVKEVCNTTHIYLKRSEILEYHSYERERTQHDETNKKLMEQAHGKEAIYQLGSVSQAQE